MHTCTSQKEVSKQMKTKKCTDRGNTVRWNETTERSQQNRWNLNNGKHIKAENSCSKPNQETYGRKTMP